VLLVTKIAALTPREKPGVMTLLQEAGLPASDVGDESKARFLVAREHDAVVGAVALETYGSEALVRSLVVSPSHRHGGLGSRLLQAAENLAAEENVGTIHLLTETAQRFFSKHRYQVTERGAAPEAIRSHAQFRSLCPASATLMSKRLA